MATRPSGAAGRLPWPWLAGATGLAVAAVLVVIVLRGMSGSFPWPDGLNAGRSGSESPLAMGADSTERTVSGEIARLEAQVVSSRMRLPAPEVAGRSSGRADSVSADPPWRAFDQGLNVLDQAIRDSREALQRDPHNPLLQKSLMAAYQKQLELIRWASRVARQS